MRQECVIELLGALNPPSPNTLNAADAAGRTALMHAAERGYEVRECAAASRSFDSESDSRRGFLVRAL